jgi:hypothetical protein
MRISHKLAVVAAGVLAATGVVNSTAQAAHTDPPASSAAEATARHKVATFRVVDETFRVRLVKPDQIDNAERLLAGQQASKLPIGKVVRGSADVNVGYTWHLDPGSFHFTDLATEVCDGRPSDVQAAAITSPYYCPWGAELIDLKSVSGGAATR